jgi:molybdopterin/thiamine biosynthesis adenylyltransferase
MSNADAARYSRNLNCWAAVAADGRSAAEIQAEIGKSHVLVLGVGGIGTSVALSLAMAGCGRLTLVDFDLVELSNLNRQLLFTVDDLGKPKAEIAKAAIEKVNPDVQISTISARLESAKQVHEIVKSVRPDFVADAVDRPTVAIDRWINSACFAERIPYSANSVSGNTALFWTKIPGQTGCYNCDDLWAEHRNPDQFELKRYREKHDLMAATSALGATAMTIGALTASEIIRYIVKWPVASAGRSILMEFATLKMTEYDRPGHPGCPVCGGVALKNPAHAAIAV